jgi:hypothetical protein
VLQFIFLVPHILAVASEPTCPDAQVPSVPMRRWSVALQSLMPGQPTVYAASTTARPRPASTRRRGEAGQVRARACANTCSTLLSRRPAGSKSHPCAESARGAGPSASCGRDRFERYGPCVSVTYWIPHKISNIRVNVTSTSSPAMREASAGWSSESRKGNVPEKSSNCAFIYTRNKKSETRENTQETVHTHNKLPPATEALGGRQKQTTNSNAT